MARYGWEFNGRYGYDLDFGYRPMRGGRPAGRYDRPYRGGWGVSDLHGRIMDEPARENRGYDRPVHNAPRRAMRGGRDYPLHRGGDYDFGFGPIAPGWSSRRRGYYTGW